MNDDWDDLDTHDFRRDHNYLITPIVKQHNVYCTII